jgi:hypothetical protein
MHVQSDPLARDLAILPLPPGSFELKQTELVHVVELPVVSGKAYFGIRWSHRTRGCRRSRGGIYGPD